MRVTMDFKVFVQSVIMSGLGQRLTNYSGVVFKRVWIPVHGAE